MVFHRIPYHGEHADGPTVIVCGVPALEASYVDPIEKTFIGTLNVYVHIRTCSSGQFASQAEHHITIGLVYNAQLLLRIMLSGPFRVIAREWHLGFRVEFSSSSSCRKYHGG